MDLSTPLLLKVAPEIDTNPTSFTRGRGRGGSVRLRFGLDSPVGSIRSALATSVHPTYFDPATPRDFRPTPILAASSLCNDRAFGARKLLAPTAFVIHRRCGAACRGCLIAAATSSSMRRQCTVTAASGLHSEASVTCDS